jgi:hypothetical protein
MNIPIPPSIYSDTANSSIRSINIVTNELTILNQESCIDLSVNQASVKKVGNYPLLQTRVFTNSPGGFNGGGTGNKSILGINMNGPLKNLKSIDMQFTNLQGGIAPIYGGTGFNQCPFVNLQVDINGDSSLILIFVLINYAASPIPPLSGIYEILSIPDTYSASWNSGLAVNVVGVTNGVVLGGITPVYQPLPASWPSTYWSFQDILQANPNAKIINFKSTDGGSPVDTVLSGMTLNSGDSAQQVFSSKLLTFLKINDTIIYN